MLFYLSIDDISFDDVVTNVADVSSVKGVSEKEDCTEECVKKRIKKNKLNVTPKCYLFKHWKNPFKFMKSKN